MHKLLWLLLNSAKIYRENRAALNIVSQAKKNEQNVWFLCVSQNRNLGDYAQSCCIRKWIAENYSSYNMLEIPSIPLKYDLFGLIKKLVRFDNSKNIIIFQSGYTSSDLHLDEGVHRKIALNFNKSRIIFFPQTVRYSSEKEALKTAAIYNNNGNIFFMARDQKSFETARKYFTGITVKLFPDVVTSLIGGSNVRAAKRNGILLCIREDSEKYYTNAQVLSAIKDIAEDECIEWTDTTLKNGDLLDENTIDKFVNYFARFKVIITDRFHGTIISLISSTPVIVIKTSDHKVTEGAKWFLDVYPNYIKLAEDVNDIAACYNSLIRADRDNPPSDYFYQKYYRLLRTQIDAEGKMR